MFGPRFNGAKLKVNLKLCVTRLQMLQKKKENQGVLSRKEIAKLLERDKEELARIRVEQIIRDDYIIEVLEILELYCSLLTSRFGLIEAVKECDNGLREAVSTLIWVTPHLQAEVSELRQIAAALGARYGKQFVKDCLTNEARKSNDQGWVSERVMHKIEAYTPQALLVDGYLTTIAQTYHVNYTPPHRLPAADLISSGDVPSAPTLFDFPTVPQQGGSSTAGGGGGASGIDDLFPAPPSGASDPGNSFPGAGASSGNNAQAPGGYPGGFPNPGSANGFTPGLFPPAGSNKPLYPPPQQSTEAPPPSFDESVGSNFSALPFPTPPGAYQGPHNTPAVPPAPLNPAEPQQPIYEEVHPPKQQTHENGHLTNPTYDNSPPKPPQHADPSVSLPTVPGSDAGSTSAGQASSDVPDFDELARRFQNLRNKSED